MSANDAAGGANHRRTALLHCVMVAVLALGSAAVAAEISLADDNGRSVTLKQPAQRIISLAPHMTELLFAAGAGERVVGTVEYSNYPAAAQRIARIGDSAQLDLERIVALKPDLIVISGDFTQRSSRTTSVPSTIVAPFSPASTWKRAERGPLGR